MSKKNKENDADKSCLSVPLSWYPGHMAKTKKQIINDLKLIDVVIEIRDARIPISSKNPDMEKIIKSKKQIIVLNKVDLANEEETKKWIRYFKDSGRCAVCVDSNTGRGINNVITEIENIMEDEKQKNESKGRIGKAIRVLVLGIPNVGKSSFINRISKRTTMKVGNKPGVTKQKQWIRVANNIELLDTPGILWPKFEDESVALNLAFTGTIKDEILAKVEIAYRLIKILLEQYENNIIERYKITKEQINEILDRDESENINIYEIMKLIGAKRGCIVSGGNIDDEKVANIILEDFRTGKLGKITLEKVN